MFKDLAQIFTSLPRIKLLKFFAFQTESQATLPTAAAVVGVSKETAKKELGALMRIGLLTSRYQKRNKIFIFNSLHPYADAIKNFLEETTLPSDRALFVAFRGVPAVTLLVATGALAKEVRGSVDLLIVTRKPKDPRITKAVHKVEMLSALPIRYAVLETRAYEGRLEANDRLLRDVFEFSHRIIIGRK